MKRVLVALLILSFALLAGCKKEDPNPELLDPIFADLDKRASEAQKSLEEQLKTIEDSEKAIEKLDPNTIELKNAQKDLAKAQSLKTEWEQRARYYKIRANRRKLVDKITYAEAFAHDKPWPDPHEYSDYLTNIRLNEINLNWNARVPKLQGRLEKPAAKPAGEGEKSAKAEE